ncbi:MAG: PmoA family protein [Candidatus Brocadiia bacterium]
MKVLVALVLVVSAGDYERIDTPIRVPCRLSQLGLTPKDVADAQLVLREEGAEDIVPAQWDHGGDPDAQQGHIVWTLPGKTPKGTARTFHLVVRRGAEPMRSLTFALEKDEHIHIQKAGKPVLRYNHGLMSQFPDKPSKFDRACYFHPLWTPSGEIITGDFHPNHLHHRGLWFSWVKVKVGDRLANFWEIQRGRGKTRNQSLLPVVGPVFAGFTARNVCTSGDKTVLRETVSCRLYAAPAAPHVFDVTISQAAVEREVVLAKIHYGGLGFRGRDEWDGRKGKVEVLTSEGKSRKNANATHARWFDYTGALPGGGWGGVIALDHPQNARYPNRVRIHPHMCFASFCLVQTGDYAIEKGEPLVRRYRFVVHEGKPDAARAERFAADFAHPPKVTLRPATK